MKVSTGALLLAIIATAPAYALTPDQMSKAIAAGAMYAGMNARIAKDICGASDDTIAAYKTLKHHQFVQDQSFDSDWVKGWNGANGTVVQFHQNMLSNPAETTEQKKDICEASAQEMKGE